MLLDRYDFIRSFCRGKRVIHLGCADWPFTERRIKSNSLLHEAIDGVAASLVGVDLASEGLALMRDHNPKWDLYLKDATQFESDEPFDVIIASELIEHIDCPGNLLRGIRQWATPSSQLVITTPNGYSLKGAIRAMANSEYAHPDHVVAFTTKTLEALHKRTGWKVLSTNYYHVDSERFAQCLFSNGLRWLGNTVLSSRIGDGLITVSDPA